MTERNPVTEKKQIHLNGISDAIEYPTDNVQQLNSEEESNETVRTLRFGGSASTLMSVSAERRGMNLKVNWGAFPVVTYMLMIAILFFSLGWLASAVHMNSEHKIEMQDMYERMITLNQVKQNLATNLTSLKVANADMSIQLSTEKAKVETTTALLTNQIKQEETKIASIAPLISRGSTSARNYDLTQSSHVTAEELNAVLKDTGLAGLGSAFIKAEKDYKINALFLAGIAMNESGNGTSKLARTKNNLFGWQAYDSNVSAAKTFATKEECIDVVASSIKKNYLSPDGCYFNGYTTSAVNIRYASDTNWDIKVTSKMTELAKDIEALRLP